MSASASDGIPLGYRQKDRKPVEYRGQKHLLTVAPNRSGKKVASLGPALIRMRRNSVVVTDPKGELATEFARWRHEVLGQKVAVFDPFHIVPDWALPRDSDGKPVRARFNPIDFIRSSTSPVSDAKLIASSVVLPSQPNPHWGNSGRAILSAHLTWAALEPSYVRPRTIESMWEDMNEPQDDYGAILDAMRVSEVCRGFVRREANRQSGGATDEMKSIRSSVYSDCSAIFDDPEILDNLSETTVDFNLLQREPISIFLCLPGSRAETHNRWTRMLLVCIFAAIERVGLPGITSPVTNQRTVFLLDEFGTTLGRLDAIRDALPRMPGYGVQFWPFVQDLNQLKTLYGPAWETFVSNSGLIQTFGGSLDLFTTEYLSKLTGQQGVKAPGRSTSTNPLQGETSSESYIARPIYFPHEIAGINIRDPLNQLIIWEGHETNELQRWVYYKDEVAYMDFWRKITAEADAQPDPTRYEFRPQNPEGWTSWPSVDPFDLSRAGPGARLGDGKPS